ncbi:hypothetical protein [Solitalea canadensis]|uniref:Muconolactone isomerase domain-containing protein n=1 Tax=Solitalea canadensis (strain ATCC 29591 / DSM 3403 / JCM 21819 / LMG 8368 / NBRC 15130 / NCIMB 12057 / USAM 9D) TaxID=929556 RepID=H8KWL7_SOLCM|nr:hypothetical protein [Solitalea canadensis]AFD08135.1 hypothetical protein Solca_3122 [Solitalea canadensis DSM 3403]
MRTLLKVTLDVAAANKALMEGSLPKIMQSTIEKLKPEASYFYTVDGSRSCFFVFDLKDVSEIPAIAEPFFMQLNAKVDLSPVMNAEDLQKGLMNLQSIKGS